jgi:hypothetical protein
MNDGMKTAIRLVIFTLILGILIGAAVFLFIHGNDLEKQERERKPITVPGLKLL